MRTVVFVCTGNTCRSPMAEAIARDFLDQRGLIDAGGVFVASAGVAAADGAWITHEAVEALRRLGIEHDGRSKRLTAQMVRKADLVLCMTAGHRAAAQALVADSPTDAERVKMLDADTDIEDPIGTGQDAYDSLAQRLKKLIPRRLREELGAAANKK